MKLSDKYKELIIINYQAILSLSTYVKASVKKKSHRPHTSSPAQIRAKPRNKRSSIYHKPDNSRHAKHIAVIHENFSARILCNTQGFGYETWLYEGLTGAGGLGQPWLADDQPELCRQGLALCFSSRQNNGVDIALLEKFTLPPR